MQNMITRLSITGLHGSGKSIEAQFEDNCLILVGENGSGKTTFLRFLYHFLSGKWFSLLQFKFTSISATIGGQHYTVTYEAIANAYKKVDRRVLSHLPPSVRNRLIDWISTRGLHDLPPDLQAWLNRIGMPLEMVARQLELFDESPDASRKHLQQLIAIVRDIIDAQILYLPTYRRIERELGSIFEGLDSDELKRGKNRTDPPDAKNSFIELVEFGMRDVQEAIKSTVAELKDFARENLDRLTLRYLGDVVNREYATEGWRQISDMSEETLESVLSRIPEEILTADQKGRLLELIHIKSEQSPPDEYVQIICHYFLKLYTFQKDLKNRERHISDFCSLCSEYISDKHFIYDSSNFGFSILLAGQNPAQRIELSDLSSGEKQIVSLFSHLYLSGTKRFFVLIDEPELSLSVPWQQRFLSDIRKGEYCIGLVAVTHSPFIYDNELKKYAHSMGEFLHS